MLKTQRAVGFWQSNRVAAGGDFKWRIDDFKNSFGADQALLNRIDQIGNSRHLAAELLKQAREDD